MTRGPATSDHMRVESIVKLVIDLLKSSILYVMADLFPILSIIGMFRYYKFFLLGSEGPFGSFDFIEVQPGSVYVYS